MFSWMKNLVLYLILSGICINLAPGNNYKRYINFFSGLVIILIIAEPIAYILHFGKNDVGSVYNRLHISSDISSIEGMENMYNYYEMSLKSAIESSLSNVGYEVYSVNCITNEDNEILKVYVYIAKSSSQDMEDCIKNLINEVYNIEPNSIYVVRR